MRTELPGGLVLRPATPTDIAETGALLGERGDPADAVDLALVVRDEGCDGVAVVVDGERVVATATLLDEVLHAGGVAIPAGQVELVATHAGYEGRGLARAVMDWAHARSRDRGHLVQVMIGIPNFYRRFGYVYSIPMATWHPVAAVPDAPAGLEVRRAVHADVAAMDAAQHDAQRGADVRLTRTASCWRWLLDRDGSEQWVATRGGAVVGVARVLPVDEGGTIGELAGDETAQLALLAALGGRTPEVLVQQRASAPEAVRACLGPATEKPEWYYLRVERVAPLLAHLAPLLLERLDAAGMGADVHDVLLSSWDSHVRFRIGGGTFEIVAEGGPEQYPVSKGGCGVPADAIPPLLFGPLGASGIEAAFPDCHLGRVRELMAVLFPPMSADLLTFYLPA